MDGVQLRVVLVLLPGLTFTAFELVLWEESPLYDPVMV